MRDAYDSICLSLEIANGFRHVMLLAPTSHSAGWFFSAISFQGYQKLADPPNPNFNHFVSCPQFLIARKKKKAHQPLIFSRVSAAACLRRLGWFYGVSTSEASLP